MEGFSLGRIYSYRLRFKAPLSIGNKTLTSREGLIIQVTGKDGAAGYGEVAPLPGYSHETLEQATHQLMHLVDLSPDDLYPSVAFGLDTALTSHERCDRDCHVNGLLIPGPQVEDQVQELVDHGFTTIKMKVGRGSVNSDIEMVNRVLETLPQGIRLRLDANRNWNERDASRFGKGLKQRYKTAIEYIEEPFENISGIAGFYRETRLGVALDESLHGLAGLKPERRAIPQGVCALILKPAMIGRTGKIKKWIELAEQMNVKVVISSCFEAGPGFSMLLEMASALVEGDTASGLDTLKYFEDTLFIEELKIERGRIAAKEILKLRNKTFDELYDQGKLTGLEFGSREGNHAR